MSLEVFAPRPSSSSSKDLSSAECFSTHSGNEREASSRLAARLERSELKRSRGKQRLPYQSGSSGQSTPRDKRHRDYGAKNRHEDQSRSDSGDTTSPKIRRTKVQNNSPPRSRPRPSSWCEPTRNEEVPDERPKSIHEVSFDRDLGFSRGSHRRSRHNHESYRIVNDYSETFDGEGRNQVGSKGEQYFLRSRSSSFSSHIGSSADEQDDNHGVYSAYDMTGRSPYGSAVNRRYSQSSLSSSSASWQPSSASLGHQVVKVFRESGTLLSSPPDESRETSSSFFSPQPESRDHLDTSGYHDNREIVYASHLDENSKQRHENLNGSIVSPMYASRAGLGLGKSPTESAQGTIVTLRKKDGSTTVPSVRDLAKRFSGNYSSLELQPDFHGTEDTRIVKAETWPKYAYVQTACDGDEDSEVVPPKPPYPPSLVEHVRPRVADEGAPPKPPLPLEPSDRALPTSASKLVRHNQGEVRSRKISDCRESKSNVPLEMFVNGKTEQQSSLSSRDALRSETSSYGEFKNSEIAVSQLIKLHEDRIASHAKSAFATSHLQIRLKRPASECGGSRWKGGECSPDSVKTNQEQEQVYRYEEEAVQNYNNIDQIVAAQAQKPFISEESRKCVARYELTELQHDRVNPIQIVEVTNKNDQSSERQAIKDRSTGRVKRHRTIGVVGYRQQIDRTAEENTERKPKRHTAIGIVTVKPTKDKPLVSSNYKEQHSEGDSFEYLPSPVKPELNEKEPESFDDSVFVEPSSEKDYQRDSRFSRQEGCRVQTSFHEDVGTQENQSRSLGVSSEDVGLDRVDDSEQALEPTVAVFVQSTKEDESLPVIDVEVKASEPVSYNQSSQPRLSFSSRSFYHSKTVPVAQVSPVSPSTTEERKIVQGTSPLQANHSAREMYETRLALWNLIPSSSTQQSYELQSPEAVCTDSSAKRTSELPTTNVSEVDTTKNQRPIANDENIIDTQKQEHYVKIIERLKKEKQEVIEKHESDKREWRNKYEEQKKVANAYQKLEDRYRRRVHELQDALANCTCQSSFIPKNIPRKSDKDAKSSNNGFLITEELQDWLSERPKNAEPAKGNNTASGDSLISSSSSMAWDEVYDLRVRDGSIDHVNGTDV